MATIYNTIQITSNSENSKTGQKTNQIEQILTSLTAWPRGLGYILQNPWILKYVLTAISLNLAVFVILLLAAWPLASLLSETILFSWMGTLALPPLLAFLWSFIFWLAFVFLITQVFSGLTSVVNAPVYSALTSKVIQKEFPQIVAEPLSPLKEILRALNFEFKKILLGLCLLLVFFLLNILPIIGSICYFLLTLLQLIFLTGLDVFEPYHSFKKLNFRSRLVEIGTHPLIYWPFLLLCGFLGSLPLLNIVLIPVSIVGVCMLIKKQD